MSLRKKEKNKSRKPAVSPGRKEDKKTEKILSFVIFAFAFLLYANTLNHGYVLDDDVVYLKNKDVQAGTSGIKSILSHSFIYGFTGHNDQSTDRLYRLFTPLRNNFLGIIHIRDIS